MQHETLTYAASLGLQLTEIEEQMRNLSSQKHLEDLVLQHSAILKKIYHQSDKKKRALARLIQLKHHLRHTYNIKRIKKYTREKFIILKKLHLGPHLYSPEKLPQEDEIMPPPLSDFLTPWKEMRESLCPSPSLQEIYSSEKGKNTRMFYHLNRRNFKKDIDRKLFNVAK